MTIHKYLAIELPVVDLYPPSLEDLQSGLVDVFNHIIEVTDLGVEKVEKFDDSILKVIRENSQLSDSQNIKDVLGAFESRDRMYDIIEDEAGGLKKGGKQNVLPKHEDAMREIFDSYRSAARVMNSIWENRGEDKNMQIRHLGGTSINKLLTVKYARGDNVDVRIFGLVGNDADGKFAKEGLKGAGLTLIDEGINLEKTKRSYIILEDRQGKPLGNRDIRTVASNAMDKLLQLKKRAIKAVENSDNISLEGSTISKGKFGTKFFKMILDTVIKNGKNLSFSQPTKPKVYTENAENIGLLQKAEEYKNMDMPLIMNETEAISAYVSEQPPAGYKVKAGVDDEGKPQDPHLKQALENIKLKLAEKERIIDIDNKQPMAIVTFGGEGAFGMTSDIETFVKGNKVENVIDTTGAGDNFYGGAVAKRNEIRAEYLEGEKEGKEKLTEEQIVDIVKAGQKVAEQVIQRKGANLPQAVVLQAVYGSDIPKGGNVTESIKFLGNGTERSK